DGIQSQFDSAAHFGRTTTGLLGGTTADDLSSLVTELLDVQQIDATEAKDHAAHQLLPAWAAKLLSATSAPAGADSLSALIHLGGADTFNLALDPQLTELQSPAAANEPSEVPSGHSDDHGRDLSSPPGHAKHHDADQFWSVASFDKPGTAS